MYPSPIESCLRGVSSVRCPFLPHASAAGRLPLWPPAAGIPVSATSIDHVAGWLNGEQDALCCCAVHAPLIRRQVGATAEAEAWTTYTGARTSTASELQDGQNRQRGAKCNFRRKAKERRKASSQRAWQRGRRSLRPCLGARARSSSARRSHARIELCACEFKFCRIIKLGGTCLVFRKENKLIGHCQKKSRSAQIAAAHRLTPLRPATDRHRCVAQCHRTLRIPQHRRCRIAPC